jgi:hypothetical protein
MGAWGPGLYSADFALDLNVAISAVAKLPLEPEQLVEAVCGVKPEAASRAADEDHAICWLVTADQFEKRGIFSRRVRDRALDIIDAGDDAAPMQALGMKPGDISTRAANLAQLRARIAAQPETTRPRKTLSAPEPYVFDVGAVYAYPTRQGRPFDYLTWYYGVTTFEAFAALPEWRHLATETRWRAPPVYGDCAAKIFHRLEMREVGVFPIDPERRAHFFPHLVSGEAVAIQDICIFGKLDIGRHESRPWARGPDRKLAPIAYSPAPTLDDLIQIK